MKICKELTVLNRKMTAYLHSAITKIGVSIVSQLLLRFLLPLGTFSCDNIESALTLKLSVCINVQTNMFRLGQNTTERWKQLHINYYRGEISMLQ